MGLVERHEANADYTAKRTKLLVLLCVDMPQFLKTGRAVFDPYLAEAMGDEIRLCHLRVRFHSIGGYLTFRCAVRWRLEVLVFLLFEISVSLPQYIWRLAEAGPT